MKTADDFGDLAEFSNLFLTAEEAQSPFPVGVVKDHGSGPILEMGGGTGRGTLQLAREFPASEVWSIESSQPMRSVLNARIADEPYLRERITVVGDNALSAELPSAYFSLVVGVHFYCQLSAQERDAFWPVAARALLPSGALLIDRHYGPKSAASIPRRLSATVTVGHNQYERWFQAEQIDVDTRRTLVEYQTIRDGQLIDASLNESVQQVSTESEVMKAVRSAGLLPDLQDSWLICRPPCVHDNAQDVGR